MVDSCSDPLLCPGGNCYACKDGKPDNYDVRCAPNCYPLVQYYESVTNMTFLIVASILFLIFLLLLTVTIYRGRRYDEKKADQGNEESSTISSKDDTIMRT